MQRVRAFQESVELDARRVRPELFHVTLAFIGERPRGTVTQLLEVAEGVEFPPCRVTLDRPGQFRKSRVGWLGTNGVPRRLQEFRQSLAERLETAGVAFDPKPWKFHVTLYRKLRKPLPIMPPVAIEWSLDRFSLMESVSTKEGVDYREISHWPRSR